MHLCSLNLGLFLINRTVPFQASNGTYEYPLSEFPVMQTRKELIDRDQSLIVGPICSILGSGRFITSNDWFVVKSPFLRGQHASSEVLPSP